MSGRRRGRERAGRRDARVEHAQHRESGSPALLLRRMDDMQLPLERHRPQRHERDARELRDMGFDQGALDRIVGWRLSSALDLRHKLVLAWAEELTSLPGGTPGLRDSLEEEFSPKEVADLTTAISLMNALNRLRISLSDEH